MNFFEQQDKARKNTGRLVALFALAVVLIIASVYLVFVVALGVFYAQASDDGAVVIRWWHPEVLLLAGGGSLLVISLGAVTKIWELRGGGAVVARSLGGRMLLPSTTNPVEQRVINVVEEMSIASGIPTPPVFLMDAETGINAFAAGYSPAGAVIGVSKGAAERLTRDELQGVVAHEFSHIFSGDMRLNIRLIGVLNGILIIGIVGYTLLRAAAYGGGRAGRSSGGKGGSPLPLLAVGAALMAIGFLGTFFGNLIKAAVSRQREFLADAAAVQFTRNPDGIAGALKRIGGARVGSEIHAPSAREASHMFFARGVSRGLDSMLSTHPPLATRIRRIDPSWDGKWLSSDAAPGINREPTTEGASGFGSARADRAAAMAAVAATGVAPTLLEQIGSPTPAHIDLARSLLARIPAQLRDAAHDPFGARAVVLALLLDRDAAIRAEQLRVLADADRPAHDETRRLADAALALDRELRLPLVDLSLAALAAMSPEQERSFLATLRAFVEADRKIDVFEFALQRIVTNHLEAQRSGGRKAAFKYYGLAKLTEECSVLLSTLAAAGASDDEQAERAFDEGAKVLGEGGTHYVTRANASLGSLSDALDTLAHVAPKLKERLIRACAIVVASDRTVTPREAELLRVIADALGVPTPPLLPGQRLV